MVYVKDDDPDSDSSRASRILFEVAGVKLRKVQPTTSPMKIHFGVVSADEKPNNNSTQNEDEMEKYLGLMQREAGINPFAFNIKKRSDYLSWDEYFMGIAFLSAQRSKDPNTQVGACIVDANKCIIGIGYNGFPRGCSDAVLPWARTGSCDLHKKYPYGTFQCHASLQSTLVTLLFHITYPLNLLIYHTPSFDKVVHAEVNAILNKCSASVRGATIYVALFPCNECSKVIIQSGIREVVYLNDFYHDTDACKASRLMFKMAGVKLRQYRPDREEIVIDFGS